MRVVFISPAYPPEMAGFTRALAEIGATVIGVGDGPEEALPDEVRVALDAYLRVPRLFDELEATETIVRAVHDLHVDRVESLWEPTVLLAARVRERLGISGMSRATVMAFRDKQLMKEKLRAAGLRVPRSYRIDTVSEAREAAMQIGFPVIIKPIAGAGSADTYHCRSEDELEEALESMLHVAEASVEEYIDGDEFTYDTVCIDGTPAFENVAQYFPRPLVFRSEQWISPAQIVYRDPYRAELATGIELGRSVLAALGMQTGFTHMEWYRTRTGEAVFGEIAARSGGGHFVDMMNWSNDFDVYRGWARAVCAGRFDEPTRRRYHVGMVFKRALGEGRITHIDGLDSLRRRCGPHLVAEDILPIGAPRRNWRQTLISDGWVAVRHADEERCREMMRWAIRDLRLFAG